MCAADCAYDQFLGMHQIENSELKPKILDALKKKKKKTKMLCKNYLLFY